MARWIPAFAGMTEGEKRNTLPRLSDQPISYPQSVRAAYSPA